MRVSSDATTLIGVVPQGFTYFSHISYAYHMPLCAGGRELRGIYPASFLLNRRGVWRSPIAVARFFAAATASQDLPTTCRL